MVYVKQYGQYRTGTNWLKALLEENSPVHVVVNALGHKHNPPVDWHAWLGRNDHDPALRLAVANDEMRVIVSVKDPYGAAFSYAKYRSLKSLASRRTWEPIVGSYCAASNATYRAWLDLVDRLRHSRSAIVRYEDLISSPESSVRQLATQLGLPTNGTIADISYRVESGDRRTQKPHDRRFWCQRQYLNELPHGAVSLIGETIDWSIFNPLGYRKLEES